jgi:hypothetical protein
MATSEELSQESEATLLPMQAGKARRGKRVSVEQNRVLV